MIDFIRDLNGLWETAPPLYLAALALWRINNVHPFVNGNGRTARAVCYFILCVKVGGQLPGQPILPELLGGPERDRYVAALREADSTDGTNLNPLMSLIGDLVRQQISSSSS